MGSGRLARGMSGNDASAISTHVPIKPSSAIVTLMCMNSLRRLSLGLMAKKPKMPSARPIHAGISAVGCALPVPIVSKQTQRNQKKRKYQCCLCHARPPSLLMARISGDSSPRLEGFELRLTYRWMRADPPLAKARTWSTVAMVVSPGKVVNRAPCAQPSLTASSGDSPVSSP